MARVVFMGTPQFAVPVLQALDRQHRVVGIVTQPDRPAGRGRQVAFSAVKAEALARDLPLYQPDTLRSSEALAHLAGWRPDVVVVAAFGQILQPPVLELAPGGCLNVHGSLLPRWRGASPVAAAILAGDPVTGVSIMRMDEGMDTGPVLARSELPITPDDTTGSLTTRLAALGADLLVAILPDWLAGEVPAEPQDPARATFCRLLSKADGRLEWTRPAVDLDRRVRACDPWPGAYTTWQGQRLKVLHVRPLGEWAGEGKPGQVVSLDLDRIGVVAGRGALELVEVQLAGKKPMPAGVFARGQQSFIGGMLGG